MVDIQNVSYGYLKGQSVIKDFSVKFDEGGIYGLLGKNGTGKSTLLYLIMGLLHARQGQILFNGIETKLRKPETLSDMFIVPEEYDLPSIKLMDYVKVIRPFYPKFSDELLDKCLEMFQMSRDVNLGHLSMGQKKKVYMCVALATNTKLLLMDEPTNGLDIPSKSQFRKVVASGMSDDKIIIISTHQVRDVELLLDKLVIIDNNRTLLEASMSDIERRLSFLTVDRNSLPENRLYEEQGLQGYNVIVPNENEEEGTPVNLELLFNALLTDCQSIQNAIKG